MKKMWSALIAILAFTYPVQAQSFRVLESKVEQGSIIVAQIAPQWRTPGLPNSSISFLGENYLPGPDGYVIIGVEVYAVPKKYDLTLVEFGRGIRLSSDYVEIEVLRVNFPKTRMTSFTSKTSGKRNKKEINSINKAFSLKNMLKKDMTQNLQYITPFDGSLDIIDPFGLIYWNNPVLPHWGIDIRVPVGTPVKAVNGGRVILVAKKFQREGNMVIINHGSGIFSVYMHLSRINIVEGTLVGRGQVLGLSGRTGMGVREPHLHFNIRVHKTYVDPLVFIDIINQHL